MIALGFPWLSHRTIAQVARTDELRSMPYKLCRIELEELQRLDEKALVNNPPPLPKGPA